MAHTQKKWTVDVLNGRPRVDFLVFKMFYTEYYNILYYKPLFKRYMIKYMLDIFWVNKGKDSNTLQSKERKV